jgi:hypothetical protein
MTAMFGVAPAASAQALPPRGQARPPQQQVLLDPGQHLVVQGNTLWDLAQQFYGNPYDWRRIWDANRDRVENPDLIYPGQTLLIPDSEGNLIEVTVAPGNMPPEVEADAEVTRVQRTIWYPREMVRETFDLARERIPAVSPLVVYGAPFLVDEAPAGEILDFGGAVETRVPRDGALMYDQLFVEFEGNPAPGTLLQAYRIDATIGGGREVAVPSAILRVGGRVGDRTLVTVESVFGQVLRGDHIRELPEYRGRAGVYPERVADAGPAVDLLGFAHPESQIHAPGEHVFIARGAAGGVQIGDEYQVRYEGSGEYPEGILQIVAVGSDYATGRILVLRNTVFEPGVDLTLWRRMPAS